MPDVSTTSPHPARFTIAQDLDRAVRQALAAELDKAMQAVPVGRGQAAATVTLRGVEASLGYKPKSWLSLGGYATRLWGGSWEAGAKAQMTWGR